MAIPMQPAGYVYYLNNICSTNNFVFCDKASSSEVPWVVKIKCKVITILHVAHLFRLNIITFQYSPKPLMDMS